MKSFNSKEIRDIFLDFFAKKDHKIVESSPLIPADPTVLFTSAGMQQFIPYLSGKTEPPFRRATSVQKCFRTSDIDSVGDESHHTFFEMLGNWSFGDYWKDGAIEWALELLIIPPQRDPASAVASYQLPITKLWVTVLGDNGEIPRDEETIRIWQNNGIPRERIKEFGLEDNFWGPVGSIGPCGPCSEIHFDRGEEFRKSECTIEGCGPNCGCGKFVEIWNLVFMEYNKIANAKFEKLPAKNVDTGAGLERIACVLQKTKSNFETDLFLPIIQEIEKRAAISYSSNEKPYHIIADHLRASCFLIAEGIMPTKEDRGYVLRRILRRAIRYGNFLKIKRGFLPILADIVIKEYKKIYPELEKNRNDILTVIQNEEEKFEKTLNRGLKEFEKIISLIDTNQSTKQGFMLGRAHKDMCSGLPRISRIIPGKDVFHLYDTFGFPIELTEELAQEKGLKIDKDGFEKSFMKHREISRAGAKKKFGGHGLEGIMNHESRIMITKLHTATHLLHAALRQVLGNHVQQAGSDINPERLRFDFSHTSKLNNKEIKLIEEIVNEKIKQGLEVKMEEMSYEEAIKSGTLAFFKERYPKIVKVYSIGDPSDPSGQVFSREICAGPHVENTKELGQFKIIKEEACMAGARRIKATLE